MKAAEIKDLLRIGASVDISKLNHNYTIVELKDFARIVDTIDESHLTISSKNLNHLELKDLARIAKSRITIVVENNC